ncbi:MAG: leucine-rich repeat domain-containing protein [Treponema sp.]|jgi:hypothetical protein|nr:leucine-rich repeat domain-containing protein [Treponema sp.]
MKTIVRFNVWIVVVLVCIAFTAFAYKKTDEANKSTTKTARAVKTASEGDFEVALTEDGTGVRIRRYNGSIMNIAIPATIQGMPVREVDGFDKSNVINVVIPEGVTLISARAFQSCEQLVQVTLPSTITEIGVEAFASCAQLAKINIPQGITKIRSKAFKDCASLGSITLPESLVDLGHEVMHYGGNRDQGYVFHNSGLTAIVWPKSLTEIPIYTFYGCGSLASVTLPEGLTYIGESAFAQSGLGSISLPSTIRNIRRKAFSICNALITVTIPNSVENIDFQSSYWGSGSGDDEFDGSPNVNLASQAALKKVGYRGMF